MATALQQVVTKDGVHAGALGQSRQHVSPAHTSPHLHRRTSGKESPLEKLAAAAPGLIHAGPRETNPEGRSLKLEQKSTCVDWSKSQEGGEILVGEGCLE